MKKLPIIGLAMMLAALGNFAALGQINTDVETSTFQADPPRRFPCRRGPTLTYTQLTRVNQRRARGELSPIVRIVSPTAGSTAARGESVVGYGSPNGTAFVFSIEVITRDDVPVAAREANVGATIRNPANLGCPNVDVPGFYAFVNKDFVTPDGEIIPKNTNLASLFNIAGTDDTPGPGVTLWLGWHVLESFLPEDTDFDLTVAFVDQAGRIGFDEIKNIPITKDAISGQTLTPAVNTFPGAASKFTAELTGDAERPNPVATDGFGSGSVAYNAKTGIATVTVNFQNLSSNQTIAHIHGPATPDAAGGIVFDIDTNATPATTNTGTFVKEWAIDAVNLERLQNGLLYFNVHSVNYPVGEVRGQIVPVVNEPGAPEVGSISPRVPTAIAAGTQVGNPNGSNGALFFIQVSTVDRSGAGIAVSENGIRDGSTGPIGLIFDGTQIGARGPNRNFPGLHVSFDVDFRQGNGNVVKAGQNLAPLFDIAGSELDDESGTVRVTTNWVVGGALVLPTGKKSITITSRVTDNAGKTGETKNIVAVSPVTSGQLLTVNP